MKAKLYYYKANGRANQIRLCFAAANIEWEESHASAYPPTPEEVASWRSIGGNTTTNVPMVVLTNDNGKEEVYCQSSAIIRAIGRKANLMPPTNDDHLHYCLDKIIADAEDLRSEAYKTVVEFGATQETVNQFVDTKLPNHLENFERQLTDDWFAGPSITVADCAAYDVIVCYSLERVPSIDRNSYPKLKAWIDRFEQNEGIVKFHDSSSYKESLYKFQTISKKDTN